MSLYLPRWAMDRRGASDAGHRPAVQAISIGSRRLVSAVNPVAEEQGLMPGMALADARAQVPNLVVAPADPDGDAAALLRLAQWCGRYSPWTVPHGPDSILLDITGCAHLAGGEEKLGAELVARLAARGVTARVGIADTIGGAWAMARGGAQAVNAIAPGGTRAALAPLLVRALRLDQDMVAALERLGLRRIGDLYPLSRADLAARFDAVLLARLDEALCLGREALSPLPPAPPRWTRRGFAEPIATADDIAAAIRLLLEELCRRLAEEALGARLLALTLHRVDGESASLAIGTARPNRDVAHLMRLFAERIDRIDPGLGIEDMVLTAKTVERLEARQLSLVVPSPLEGEGSEQRNAASGWGVRSCSASPPTPPLPLKGGGGSYQRRHRHAHRPAGEPARRAGRGAFAAARRACAGARAAFRLCLRARRRRGMGRGQVAPGAPPRAAGADRSGSAGAGRSAADVPLAQAASSRGARRGTGTHHGRMVA